MSLSVSRRALLVGTGILMASGLFPASAQRTPRRTPSPTPDDETTPTVARVEGVTLAEQILYSNIKRDSILDEPILLVFTNYVFDDETAATAGFATIAEHMNWYLQEVIEDPHQKEISIGRIGDDRAAFYAEKNAPTISAAIRVGAQVLTVIGMGLGGDISGFVGTFLEEHLPIAEAEGRSLLPELADMPLGWEAAGTADDVTEKTMPENATPTNK